MSKTEKIKVDKKTTKKKSTNIKKNKTIKDLNIWVYNENEQIEMVVVPIKYRMDYISRFGTKEITSKSNLENWLEFLTINVINK